MVLYSYGNGRVDGRVCNALVITASFQSNHTLVYQNGGVKKVFKVEQECAVTSYNIGLYPSASCVNFFAVIYYFQLTLFTI